MFNLYTIVKAIEKIGNAIPDVNTVVLSDIFKLNELPDIDYSVFAIIQDQHREDDEYVYMNFYLYYVDRLLNDHSNQLEIQSHGMSLLSTVIGKIEDLGIVLSPDTDRIFQPFNQRFSDECAGVYARVEIMVPVDCSTPFDVLVNPLLADLATYQPGTYYPQDFGADAFRVVTVSGQSYHYYTEQGKTGKIDNGEHSLSVEQSGVYVDGKEVTTNDVLSGYTYNKETTNNLIQAALEGFDDVIAQVSANTSNISANTADISTLSAQTSANTSDIQDILQRISGLTGDYVEKQPTYYSGSNYNIDNPLDLDTLNTSGYYVIEAMSDTNTINKPDDGRNAVMHAICYYKENEQGLYLDDALQIYFTADDETTDTRIYMRRHSWFTAQSVNVWGPWVLISGGGSGGQIDTQMDDNSTNPVQNKVIKKYADDKYGILGALITNLQGEVEELKRQMSGQTSGQTVSGNVIYYTTHTGEKVPDNYWSGFTSMNIVSQTIENGKWKAVFDGNIVVIDGFWPPSYMDDFVSIEIPPTVVAITNAFFRRCHYLTGITLPSSVKYIGSAFSGCTIMTTADLGGVVELEVNTFVGCESLTSITFGSDFRVISPLAFGSHHENHPRLALLRSLIFTSMTAPVTATKGDMETQCMSPSGTVYAPIGSDYSSFMAKMPVGWSVQYI